MRVPRCGMFTSPPRKAAAKFFLFFLQKLCPASVDLVTLAGTYRWIYLTETSFQPIEFRYESNPEVLKNRYPGFPGFLKISFPEDEKPSLENIKGEFHLWDIKGSFIGVAPRKYRAGGIFANAWDINEVEWDPQHCRGTYGITTGH